MAVFRVEKTKDFTIMSNHHLRNTELSLKAKGLLSLMLSLPEDWDCTKSLARWLALRTIRSPLFFKNKSSSFFVYVILLSYHTQTITHKRTAMLMLSCFFILNNYISDFFIRPPPFRCLFLLFHLQTSFILGGSLWTNILILTER